MKTIKILGISLSLLAPVSFLQGSTLLQSFENASYAPTFYYDTGDWSGTPSVEGFSITTGTAGSASGFGQTLAASFDLTTLDDLAVTIKLLPGNQAEYINVMLRTLGGSGTNGNMYTFATSSFNEDTFTTVSIGLSNYSFQLGSGADLANIDRIQIQGSGSNVATDNIRFQIQSVAAIPELSTSAMLFGCVVLALALLRRRGRS